MEPPKSGGQAPSGLGPSCLVPGTTSACQSGSFCTPWRRVCWPCVGKIRPNWNPLRSPFTLRWVLMSDFSSLPFRITRRFLCPSGCGSPWLRPRPLGRAHRLPFSLWTLAVQHSASPGPRLGFGSAQPLPAPPGIKLVNSCH